MLEAVERRFGTYRAPAVIDMLSDNGSPYIARDTQIFVRQLGLKPCFTPVRSPQSNGISEAFVKTLKHDYVQVTPPPDARTVLELIGARIPSRYSAELSRIRARRSRRCSSRPRRIDCSTKSR